MLKNALENVICKIKKSLLQNNNHFVQVSVLTIAPYGLPVL